MAPDLILVVAGLSAAWAVFSIVGGERVRVLQKAEFARRANQTAPETDARSSNKQLAPTAPAGKPSK